MRCWTCAWIEQTTNTPQPTFSRVLRWEKENDRGRKCNLTCRRCTRCCKFAQIWHPSPYNYIFRSFEVGNEKGRTEEIESHNLDTTTHNFIFPNLANGIWKIKTENMQIRLSQVHEMLNMCYELNKLPTPNLHFLEFWGGKKKTTEEENVIWLAAGAQDVILRKYDTPDPTITFSGVEVGSEKGRTEEIEFDNLLYHHPQFHSPEPWSGTWKIKTENMQIRLPQVHEMLNMCMNWTDYQHPTPTFSRVLRWEKENDRGRKCNLTCRRCTKCCNFAQIWHPFPYNYIFRSFEVGNEKGRTEEIESHNLDTTTHNFIFPNLEMGYGK